MLGWWMVGEITRLLRQQETSLSSLVVTLVPEEPLRAGLERLTSVWCLVRAGFNTVLGLRTRLTFCSPRNETSMGLYGGKFLFAMAGRGGVGVESNFPLFLSLYILLIFPSSSPSFLQPRQERAVKQVADRMRVYL